mgnify:FL=1
MTAPLTKRQKQVLDAIAAFIKKHGYSPSFRELAAALNLRAESTVHKHIVALVGMGYVLRAKHGGYRDIQLVPEPVRALKSCENGHAVCWFAASCPACGMRGAA